MIDFYTAPTPNGHRVAVALEECNMEYRVHKLNLRDGEQFDAGYRAINPAAMVPAIVDSDGPGKQPLVLSQSGAITLYLAEKSGRFIPQDASKRCTAFQWFMQASSDCAMCSQTIAQLVNHAPVKSASSVEFFGARLIKMFGDVNARLSTSEFLGGDEFGIADIALYPIAFVRKEYVEQAAFNDMLRWMEAVSQRPAVQRGMKASL